MRVPLILTALVACAPKVQVPIAAHPAVDLPAASVAVVAADRACQPIADALVDRLWSAGFEVDPRSRSRAEVALCGDDAQVAVEQSARADDPGEVHRRTAVIARAHALVVIRVDGAVRAHVVGTGRHRAASPWDARKPIGSLSRAGRREAREQVATDVAEQLTPNNSLVGRRVWPRAPEGSAKGLATRAILAEQRGDLATAVDYARAAYMERPSARAAAYLAEVRRRSDANAGPSTTD